MKARPTIIFVFPSRGTQWQGMLRELYEELPVFRNVIHRCDQEIRRRLGWSLEKEIQRERESDRLYASEARIEPAITALQLGVTEVWRSHGIHPDAVLGMSGGEFAAACAAGALTVEEAIRLACCVSLVIRAGLGRGTMVSVNANLAEIRELQRSASRPLYLTAQTGPRTAILATANNAVDALLVLLAERGFQYTRIQSAFAFHSALVEEWKDTFILTLRELRPRPAVLPVYSALSGGLLQVPTLDASHWWHVVRQSALSADAIFAALEDGCDTFLEIAPHPIVSRSIEEIAALQDKHVQVLPSLRRNQSALAVLQDSRDRLQSQDGAAQPSVAFMRRAAP